MAYDPRFIANLILDIASQEQVSLTNLEVNKIAYFLHALYLAERADPLIDAKIEAWDYGPVVREIYSEFKKFGAEPITARATKFDVDSLSRVVAYQSIDDADYRFVMRHVQKYMRLGASKLVGLSHERGGPWDRVYNATGKSNPGMEISNDIIREYFAKQTRH